MLSEFIALQQEGKWLSELTRRAARWQLTVFLNHLERRGMALADVEATDIDAFYEHMALRWGRTSLHRSATVVRVWLRYCETKGYARLGLADAILLPRIYRDEALPMGPTWDTVGRMLAATSGDEKARPENLVVAATAIAEASPFPRHCTKTPRECPGGRRGRPKRPGAVIRPGWLPERGGWALSPRKMNRKVIVGEQKHL